MPRVEETSGHALRASAKHIGNVTDGVPVADEGFSSCTICAEGCEFMEHLAEIAIRRAATRAQPPTFQVLPSGFLGSRLAGSRATF
jgi:hypothetical protein